MVGFSELDKLVLGNMQRKMLLHWISAGPHFFSAFEGAVGQISLKF